MFLFAPFIVVLYISVRYFSCCIYSRYCCYTQKICLFFYFDHFLELGDPQITRLCNELLHDAAKLCLSSSDDSKSWELIQRIVKPMSERGIYYVLFGVVVVQIIIVFVLHFVTFSIEFLLFLRGLIQHCFFVVIIGLDYWCFLMLFILLRFSNFCFCF